MGKTGAKTEEETPLPQLGKDYTVNDKGEIVIQLSSPFKFGEDDITEVSMVEPKVAHLRGFNIKKLETETDEMFKLLGKLIGRGNKFIDEMSFKDSTKCMEVIQIFL